MNKYCRICITEKGTVKIFYETMTELPVSSRIMNCALVKVFLNDGLPDMICEKCLENLNVAFSFKSKCEESDTNLRRMLTENAKEVNHSTDIGILDIKQENAIKDCETRNMISNSSDSLNYCLASNDSVREYISDDNVNADNDDVIGKNIPVSNAKTKCRTRLKRTRKKGLNKEGSGSKESAFICEVCSKSYKSHRQMRRHQIVHTDEKRYVCRVCSKQFHYKGNLQVHERIHTGERPFLCNSCGKSFVQVAGLQRHLAVHNDEKPHRCQICDKRFKLADTLAGHVRTHTLERPYKCTQCDKRFTHHSALNKHAKVHTGERNHQCAQCGKSFTRSDSLAEHVKIHTGERPFPCVTCGAAFTSKSTLRVHNRIHTSERPFRCEYCEKCFAQSSVLRRHHRTHTGECPYKCTLCEKSFPLKARLVEHIRSAHSDDVIDTHTNNISDQFALDSGNIVQDSYPNTVMLHNNLINVHNSSNLQVNTNLHLANVNVQEEHFRYLDIVKSSHPYYQV